MDLISILRENDANILASFYSENNVEDQVRNFLNNDEKFVLFFPTDEAMIFMSQQLNIPIEDLLQLGEFKNILFNHFGYLENTEFQAINDTNFKVINISSRDPKVDNISFEVIVTKQNYWICKLFGVIATLPQINNIRAKNSDNTKDNAPYLVKRVPSAQCRLMKSVQRGFDDELPYNVDDIRSILLADNKDVSKLDQAIVGTITIRREYMAKFSGGKLLPRSQFRWTANNKPSKSREIVLGLLISPFINKKTFDAVYKDILHFVEVYLNKNVAEAEAELKVLVTKLSKFDDYVLNWGLLERFVLEFDALDINYIMPISKPIQNIFFEHFVSCKKVNTIANLSFPKYKSKLANISIIPKGTYLYRGFANDFAKGGLSINRNFEFFALDFITTSFYSAPAEKNYTLLEYQKALGGTAVFKTKVEAKVLNLADEGTVIFMQNLFKQHDVPEDVQKSFKTAWKITGNGKVIRSSGASIDAKIVDWMCKLGFSGYIGLDLFDEDGGSFHDEIMFCNPTEYVELDEIFMLKDNPYLSLMKITGPQTQALMSYN